MSNVIRLLTDRCSLCPSSSRVPAGRGGLPAQRSAQWLQPNFLGGTVWSLQAPTAPLLLFSDLDPSFFRATPPPPPERPTVGRRTPLPCSGSFSLQPTPRGGVRPGCEENHERSRKGLSLQSAPSSDLGPPSLLLTLPATQGSSSQHPTPLHYKCSCSSAVDQSHQGRGSECRFLGSIPKDLIQEVT